MQFFAFKKSFYGKYFFSGSIQGQHVAGIDRFTIQ